MSRHALRQVALAVGCLAVASSASAEDPWGALAALLPSEAAGFAALDADQLASAAKRIDQWSAEQMWGHTADRPEQVLRSVERLLEAKRQVDGRLSELLARRGRFSELPAGAERQAALQGYLRATSCLIDASGRLRYALRDAVDTATLALDPHPAHLSQLIDRLTAHKLSIGAAALSYALFDPPAASGGAPFPVETKRRILRLIAAARSTDLLPPLAAFLNLPDQPAELVMEAAEAVRQIGLPQDPGPGQDPTLPGPALTADDLLTALRPWNSRRLSPALARRRDALVSWAVRRATYGELGGQLRVGRFEIAEGDWLLMRNPSPYNRFTDLSPGLFTHVGVVVARRDADGKRRFLIVDLPERGDRIPATNADLYLQRTLHFVFLRHPQADVARQMADAARSMIGNETQFDLHFDTQRVRQWKGQSLANRRIHTYCAGFLLLCAQQTGRPEREFFPIVERPASARCLNNLQLLGLSISDEFVSPTGALFSTHLQLVGQREPMYEPGREIKEAVYDHFAERMIEDRLEPSPDAYQALREKIASLSKYNPWLARALARANNVSEHMDLESAAKSAAVIETLDEIAEREARRFQEARRAILAGPLDGLAERELRPEDRAAAEEYRRRHEDLFRRWTRQAVTPRRLRLELVEYYAQQGRQALDRRFFPD